MAGIEIGRGLPDHHRGRPAGQDDPAHRPEQVERGARPRFFADQRDGLEIFVGAFEPRRAVHGVAECGVAEAALTAEAMGNRVKRIWDAGVAGIHRILAEREILQNSRVVVVAAGMEGALPSVVGGLVKVPVIAVPTSIGYGASFNGLAALLGMLNSCASNVTVVNIDNGFGAGFVASLINRKWQTAAEHPSIADYNL